MKKYFLLMILICLYFCGNPTDVYGKEYEITGYHITIHVQEDGSIDIIEDITYYFDGKFNGKNKEPLDIS